MKKWKYKIVWNDYSEDDLNNLGSLGWELVSASEMSIRLSREYIFKREI